MTILVQQLRAEIERLQAENAELQHLLEQHMPRTDAGCEPGWSRVVKAQELQAQVDQLELESESLRGLLRQVVNELPHRNSGTDGNAPGHGHRTPGVWDGDNGPLSGKPCAWCAIWAAAKAEVERHG